LICRVVVSRRSSLRACLAMVWQKGSTGLAAAPIPQRLLRAHRPQPSHMDIFWAMLRIWTPCTREAPRGWLSPRGSLRHLRHIGSLLQAPLSEGVNAVGTLDRMGDRQSDERLFTLCESAFRKHGVVIVKKNFFARSGTSFPISSNFGRSSGCSKSPSGVSLAIGLPVVARPRAPRFLHRRARASPPCWCMSRSP